MSGRPNVLLVHWHDTGRHLGAYGVGSVESPHVDALAAEGIRLDNAFAAAPVCSPSRGSLFTGRYPHANGLMGLSNLGWEYAEGERTLPMLLRDAGYRTALIGLQHESWHTERTGFEETHAIGESIASDFRYCGMVADAAERWLEDAGRNRDRPFFASVGFWEAHRPWPLDRYEPSDPAEVDVPGYLPDNRWTRDDLAPYEGSIRTADAAFGRVLAALDRAGLADETLVVFTTDHGIPFPRAKCTLFDAGISVALVLRPPSSWPDAPRGPSDRLWSHVDFAPTILELAGAERPANLQGVSHAAWLTGRDGAPVRDRVYAENTYHDRYDPVRAVRTTRFKYVENAEERPRLVMPLDYAGSATSWGMDASFLEHRPARELYDLADDPLEQRNLVDDPAHAARRDELAADLRRWQEETGDPLLAGPVAAPPLPRLEFLGALPERR
ncbi:MAG TPA: sulfatase [Gaiellaceae bacterium]|nr:sulfatase [Gaiellaceae bacterium]